MTEPRFDFDAAVAEVYQTFGETMNNVVFVNAKTWKVVHPDETVRRSIVDAVNNNAGLRETINPAIAYCQMKKSSLNAPVEVNGALFHFVCLYLADDRETPLNTHDGLAVTAPVPAYDQYFLFDHELAHALIPAAHHAGTPAQCESIADTYAAIRHFQRFGTQTDTVETLTSLRAAFSFMLDDCLHFTSPALEALAADKKTFIKLDPWGTLFMANTLGKANHAAAKDMKALAYHARKFRRGMKNVKDDRPLRKLAELAFTARSTAVGKWASTALQAFADEKVNLLGQKREIKLDDLYWDVVREALKAQDSKPPRPKRYEK